MDDIIFLGCTCFSNNSKNYFKISYAVKMPDKAGSDYIGLECGMELTSQEIFDKLKRLKSMDHFKGIVIRQGKEKGYTLRLIRVA